MENNTKLHDAYEYNVVIASIALAMPLQFPMIFVLYLFWFFRTKITQSKMDIFLEIILKNCIK